MVTFSMIETSLNGLSKSLIDDDRLKSRSYPRLREILRIISLLLAFLKQINNQISELEKFKESYENQNHFINLKK